VATGEDLFDAKGGTGKLRPVMFKKDSGRWPADVTARARPGFYQALGDQNLERVFGCRLADAIVRDDRVP
jgi:hypothetical protein